MEMKAYDLNFMKNIFLIFCGVYDVINFSIFDDVIDDVIEVGKISKNIF